ncbi:hypothetical protein AB0M47_39085 [Hamadaea sp. NPDC051192]|uniref:hypothetical protein n=1 Tax=Hamadaea sp. NPDC051192 TaxID=3154940 RepID=UPI0034229A95
MGSVGGALVSAVLSFLAAQLGHILDWLWQLLTASVFISPDVTGFPQVRHMSSLSQAVVNTAMLLIIAVIGTLHLLSGGAEQSRYTLRMLGPRFAMAMVAANCSSLIVSVSIRAANELTRALTGVNFSTQDAIRQIRDHLASVQTHPDTLLLELVLHNCLTVALAALLVSWMVRFGQLVIVAGVAPVALACHTFPATQPIADGWWRTLAGALVTQVLQATALTVAWSALADPQGSFAVKMGLPVDPNGTLNLALAALVTAQVALIPRFVRRMLRTGSGGGSTLSGLFRMLVVQQVVGRLRMRGRGTAAAVPRGSAIRNQVHYHSSGERQVTNLYGENAVQHSHVHERGSHQYSHQHTHLAPSQPRPVWRPARTGSPASLRLRRRTS